MARKNEKVVGGIQIGTSFLVLIFVVLALVIFSVLSLLSALSENKLTEKNEEAVQAYYAADGLAEEKLSKLDGMISKVDAAVGDAGFQAALSEELGEGYNAQTGIVSYIVPINENLSLFVDLQVLYGAEAKAGGKHYRILRWQEENVSEYELDDSLKVWMGDE